MYELALLNGYNMEKQNKNPWLCENYRSIIKLRHMIRNSKRKISNISKNFRKLDSIKYQNTASIFQFENKMLQKTMQICGACHGKFLSNNILKKNAYNRSSVCNTCQNVKGFQFDKTIKEEKNYQKQLEDFYLRNEMLPVWYKTDDIDKKEPQYHIPNELKEMTLTEQLLIQIYSAYVPVFCINRKGNVGYKGHCVCFPQDLNQVCESLPRTKTDVIRVIKKYIQSNEEVITHFKVRKSKVMTALIWLKAHNKYYKDITIDESNLSWMSGDEDSIIDQNTMISLKEIAKPSINNDTPYVSVVNKEVDGSDDKIMHNMGLSNNSIPPTLNENDKKITNAINDKLQEVNTDDTIMFPNIASKPVTEYDEDIFPKIFPTLYPGGIGGFNNHIADINKKKYGKRMLSYEDGRFCTSKTWSFYMMDVIQRDKNNKDGNYVIKSGQFGKDFQTLDDLLKKIDNGDMSWINMIRNYSHRIRGSDNYWRSKKYELEAWIRHHVSKKNGPPTLFITLSCAENWWPDLKRILIERLEGTLYESLIDDMKNKDTNISMKATRKAAELFSITVQQFFQIRVQEWIDTVGKKALDIEFYWGRYEFTKGRGQIHIHMLCITRNRHVFKQYYKHTQKGQYQKAIDLLSEYAERQFGMTAEHPSFEPTMFGNIDKQNICDPEGNANIEIEMKNSLPKRYHEVNDPDKDLCHLCNACQLHKCNSFCMRECLGRKNSNGRKKCRCGCGIEQTKGACDTPGFPLMKENKVITEKGRNIKRLHLKRKGSRKFVQTSTIALQSWRANCDIQILIYDSSPEKPNLEEIRRVSDYVVAYTTKVNQTTAEERRVCLDIAKAAASEYSSEHEDITTVIKRILNSFNGKRIIPRQEVMVELDELPLILCSEKIQPINISGGCRIFYKPQYDGKGKSFLSHYANRKENYHHLNLLEYFYTIHNGDNVIPFPLGRKTTPTYKKMYDGKYVVHPEFKKTALILYKPWKLNECQRFLNDVKEVHKIYDNYVESSQCSILLKQSHKMAKKYIDNPDIESVLREDTYMRFDEGYTPSNADEEEMYFTFLRSRQASGNFMYCGHTIKINHQIKWWEKECIVSNTWYDIIFL